MVKKLIILKAVLLIVTTALLACAGMAGYAFVLMRKRPLLALYESRRRQPDFLPIGQIPPWLIQLIVRQEDPNFYTHPGFDIEAIRKNWRTNKCEGRIVLGASTISQQLAKNLYLRFTRNYLRKTVELLIALALERRLGKTRILELYVNIIYYGFGIYGIANATRFYFDKSVSDLSFNQMVMLAIIPSAPTTGNPIQHPEVFERLRNGYLVRFTEEAPPLISRAQAEDILGRRATCLDPELRAPDDFTRSYPSVVPMINERFGPLSSI